MNIVTHYRDEDEPEDRPESDREYLLALAEKIFRIPALYGVDQADYERLREIAAKMQGDAQ